MDAYHESYHIILIMISKNEWDVPKFCIWFPQSHFVSNSTEPNKYSIEIGYWHSKSNLSLLRNWSRKKKIGGFCTQCQASSILWRLLKKRHAKTNCLWIKWCSLFKSSKQGLKAMAQSIVKYVLHLPLITKYTKYLHYSILNKYRMNVNYFKIKHVTSLFFFYPLLNNKVKVIFKFRAKGSPKFMPLCCLNYIC